MPQLSSGRHVGVSSDTLMDWAEHRAHNGDYLKFILHGRQPADLWADIEVVYYQSVRTVPGTDQVEPSEPYRAGFTVAHVRRGECDLSAIEQEEFLDWTASSRVTQWLNALYQEVLALLKSKPLPDALKGIMDDD